MLTFVHNFGKVPVLGRVLEGDEVHAPLPAEVPGVEPIPVLENAVFLGIIKIFLYAHLLIVHKGRVRIRIFCRSPIQKSFPNMVHISQH